MPTNWMMAKPKMMTARTRRKYNSIYQLLAIVDGSDEAYRFCGARGVWSQDGAGLIFEGAKKRHAKWGEIHYAEVERPYLIWRKEGFLYVEPEVCSLCNQEIEPHKLKDGTCLNVLECNINVNKTKGAMIEDSHKELGFAR